MVESDSRINHRYMWYIFSTVVVIFVACNNPFSTRTPQTPDNISGITIKPPTTPENVLYNLRASFENLSVQDYLNNFTEDFIFNPDPDDSVKYEQEFSDGWNYDKERTFAENFLQSSVVSSIEVYPLFEYKPVLDAYEYSYSIKIFPADSTITVPYDVKGLAWMYLRETQDGKWKIYKWVELTNMVEGAFLTWGVLKALNI